MLGGREQSKFQSNFNIADPGAIGKGYCLAWQAKSQTLRLKPAKRDLDERGKATVALGGIFAHEGQGLEVHIVGTPGFLVPGA